MKAKDPLYEYLKWREKKRIDSVLDEIDENEDVQLNLIDLLGRSNIIAYLKDTLEDLKKDPEDELYQDIQQLVTDLEKHGVNST